LPNKKDAINYLQSWTLSAIYMLLKEVQQEKYRYSCLCACHEGM